MNTKEIKLGINENTECRLGEALKGARLTSLDSSVAEVDEGGAVMARGEGSTYVLADFGNGNEEYYRVTVQSDGIDAIGLNLCELVIEEGDSYQMTATVTPSSSSETYKWYSGDSSVVSVNSATGVIMAKKIGCSYVYARNESGTVRSENAYITVTEKRVKSITVSPMSLELDAGATATLGVSVAPLNASNKRAIWHSCSPQVAEVDAAGTVTARSAGLATVYAVSESSGVQSNYCTVSVRAAASRPTVVLSKASINGVLGESYTLTYTVTPSSYASCPEWSTENSKIARVENGVVRLVGTGSTVVRVRFGDDSTAEAACCITVTAPSVTDYSICQKNSGIKMPASEIALYQSNGAWYAWLNDDEKENPTINPNDVFNDAFYIQKVCEQTNAESTVSGGGCRVCCMAMYLLMKAGVNASVGDNTYYAVKNTYKGTCNKYADLIAQSSDVAVESKNIPIGDKTVSVVAKKLYRPYPERKDNNLTTYNILENADLSKGNAYILLVKLDDKENGSVVHGVLVYAKNENANSSCERCDDIYGLSKYLVLDPSYSDSRSCTDLYGMMKSQAVDKNPNRLCGIIQLN